MTILNHTITQCTLNSLFYIQHKGDDIMFPEPEDGSPGLAIDETIHYLDTWKVRANHVISHVIMKLPAIFLIIM